MAGKSFWNWINVDTGAESDVIDSNGTYLLNVINGELNSTLTSMLSFVKYQDNPAGATIELALRVKEGIDPEKVTDGSITLTDITTGSISLPVLFFPKGDVCIIVSNLVAPFYAGVIQ